ncbi:MAG TPA: ribose-phosphate pyrophosphokinase [bacterium]|nr:ribose-phosphate pyrophosphokinase [bacterium]
MAMSLKLFTGNSNPALAREVADSLGIGLGKAAVKKFSDGEIQVEIDDNVRGVDVFLLQSTCPPVNENLMELLVMCDAMRRASAARITAVIPYYGYARQDRKVAPRAPITAKLVADLIVAGGAERMLSMDLHAGQIQGFFNIPFDHLFAMPVSLEYIRRKFNNRTEDIVVVSPDAGGVERARAYAKRLGASLAIIDKRRSGPNVAEVMNIIGDVKGRDVVIVDDMIDTAGTLTQGAKAMKDAGAKRIFSVATHAVLSGPAVSRIKESVLDGVGVTNTIGLSEAAKASGKIEAISVAGLFAESIRRIHHNDSVSSLFV